ncbi:MAG: GspE/PulE family protein [Patescibacteria group bacterium]
MAIADYYDDQKISDILVHGNYVAPFDFGRAKIRASKRGLGVIDYLIEEGELTKDLVGQAMAESYGVPYADLNSRIPSREQVLQIPEDAALKFRAVLFTVEARRVTIATDHPDEPELKSAMQKILPRREITIAYSLPEDLDATFVNYRAPLETRFKDIVEKEPQAAPKLIDAVFDDAIAYHASDIHFEPQEHDAVIRLRIDGVLHEAGRIAREYYENIVNRIKVQAHLRIDEHFAAQDGAMRYKREGGEFDLRISVIPTLDGEKIAIRVLTRYIKGFNLIDLGFSAREQDLIMRVVRRPYGMILTTGPTGSGKTTTLYALLKIVHQPEVNITTIEDPVEYKIAGVNQIQVNAETELTFAKGLRAIVRQDPDIILVGEIRDHETAEIAVNSALTGHLLLSTLHANDAATAIPRLLSMGIEPFLLASTLKVVIAQRLVRRICETCRYSEVLSGGLFAKRYPQIVKYWPENSATFYRGEGCSRCGKTGYRGLIGLFEMISVTGEMHDMILRHPTAQQIMVLARKQGTRSLFEDGIAKVQNGVTTIDELRRVAPPPQFLEAGRVGSA